MLLVVIDAGDFGSHGRMIDSYLPGCWLTAVRLAAWGRVQTGAAAASGRALRLSARSGSAMEWDTLVRHNVAVVSRSATTASGFEKHPMEALYGYSVVAEPGTRYDEVVRALGGHGELVSVFAESRPALNGLLPVACPLCQRHRPKRGLSTPIQPGFRRPAGP